MEHRSIGHVRSRLSPRLIKSLVMLLLSGGIGCLEPQWVQRDPSAYLSADFDLLDEGSQQISDDENRAEDLDAPDPDLASLDEAGLHEDLMDDWGLDLNVEDRRDLGEADRSPLAPREVQLTVRGAVSYPDRIYDDEGYDGAHRLEPAPYVTVELMNVLSTGEARLIATGHTDHEGRYRFRVRVKAPLSLKVRALSKVVLGLDQSRVIDRSDLGALYAIEHTEPSRWTAPTESAEAFDAPERALLLTLPDLIPREESSMAGALNILEATVTGFEQVRVHSREPLPLLTYRWVVGRAFSCGSCYGRTVISLGGQVEDPDQYDDHIILHEMGHFIISHLSVDDSPGGSHRGRAVSPLLAYGEGVAYFWASLVMNDPLIVDWMYPTPWVVDIERGIFNGAPVTLGVEGGVLDGAHHEELVSTALWDITDSVTEEEPEDLLSLGEERVMSILFEDLPQYEGDVGAAGIDLADWLTVAACATPLLTAPLLTLSAQQRYPWGEEELSTCGQKSEERLFELELKEGAMWLIPTQRVDQRPLQRELSVAFWLGTPPNIKPLILDRARCEQLPCNLDIILRNRGHIPPAWTQLATPLVINIQREVEGRPEMTAISWLSPIAHHQLSGALGLVQSHLGWARLSPERGW